uniref:Zinc finger protein 576 n=1 Tax=Myotis myotis TaxID=51298 RepID=A0A7J7SE77_MYOMY|nr:zinc finger protein 576 [Myotis myotis]
MEDPLPSKRPWSSWIRKREESPQCRRRHPPSGGPAVHPLPHHLRQFQVPAAPHEAGAPSRLRGPEAAGGALHLLHLRLLLPLLQGPERPPAQPQSCYQALPDGCTHHCPDHLPLP